MMDDHGFERCVKLILELEGGATVTKDKFDPGGTTKYGISQRAHPNVDIERLDEATARDIYKREYWDAMMCDSIPWPLNLCVFDCAVNNGMGRAIKFLTATSDPAEFLTLRLNFYRSLDNWQRYGHGWTHRLQRVAEAGGIPWQP